MTAQHNEKDDCAREDVRWLSFVLLTSEDFRGLVPKFLLDLSQKQTNLRSGSSVGLKDALDGRGPTEVSDLEVVSAVKEQVIRLKVSVCDSLLVAIFNGFDELNKVGSGEVFGESSAEVGRGDLEVLEESAFLSDFHDNGNFLKNSAIFLNICQFFGEILEVDEVRVVELLQHQDLVLDFALADIRLEELDGNNFFGSFMLTFLYSKAKQLNDFENSEKTYTPKPPEPRVLRMM
mgnify:CR=1 FL=1